VQSLTYQHETERWQTLTARQMMLRKWHLGIYILENDQRWLQICWPLSSLRFGDKKVINQRTSMDLPRIIHSQGDSSVWTDHGLNFNQNISQMDRYFNGCGWHVSIENESVIYLFQGELVSLKIELPERTTQSLRRFSINAIFKF